MGIPRDGLPQLALAGRSNVGKSALINALGRKKIARTSAAPGKTRLANIYRLTVGTGAGKWGLYLIDLPGYGYARGGADSAAELKAVSEAYFATQDRLNHGRGAKETERAGSPAGNKRSLSAARGARTVSAALLLVDSRHPELESDIQAARWLDSIGVEFHVVATKIDKLSRRERARNCKTLENSLGTPPLAVSAASGEGMDALWKTIASLVKTGHE